jgi:hypothetical protein
MQFKFPSVYYLFVITLVFFSACKKESTPVCAHDWEVDPAGQWYRGDLHVHATDASNDTGGDSYPSDIKQKAQEAGLDFVVLTDHSNSTGSDPDTTYEDPALFNMGPEFPYWDSAAMLTDLGNFLMICGNELSPRHPGSEPTGHIGCLPFNLNTFDQNYVFTDRPMGTVDGANTLNQASEAGCFKVLNHPYAFNRWIAFDWTSYDYNAMEVWNGTIGYDDFDKFGYDAWICDLLAGRQVSAIGGSDNHRVFTPAPGQVLDPALGYPTTMVFAESLSWDNIMQGLSEGNTAIVEGDSRIFIDDYTKGKCRANGEDVAWVRLRGEADVNLVNPKLTLYHFTSCNDPRPNTDAYPIPEENVLVEIDLSAGSSFDEGVEVEGQSGVYTAVLSGDGYHYWALSKAIVIK